MRRHTILVTPYQIARWEAQALVRLTQAGFDLVVNDGDRYWSKDELVERARPVDCIFASSGRYDASTLAGCDRLKLIVKFGVGYDNIDLHYCDSRGITVAAALGSNQHAVADYAMALLLASATGILGSNAELRQGVWKTTAHHDLHGATLGILGLGRIGVEIARRARGFNTRIVYWDVAPLPEREAELGATFVTLDELARDSDFVSVNLPLTDGTANIVSASFLEQMRPTSFLINTARGGIVDEIALYAALKSGRIAGAASDVFEREPAIDNPLLALPNFIGTPHTSAVSFNAVHAMTTICATCATDFFTAGHVPPAYLIHDGAGH